MISDPVNNELSLLGEVHCCQHTGAGDDTTHAYINKPSGKI